MGKSIHFLRDHGVFHGNPPHFPNLKPLIRVFAQAVVLIRQHPPINPNSFRRCCSIEFSTQSNFDISLPTKNVKNAQKSMGAPYANLFILVNSIMKNNACISRKKTIYYMYWLKCPGLCLSFQGFRSKCTVPLVEHGIFCGYQNPGKTTNTVCILLQATSSTPELHQPTTNLKQRKGRT